MPAEIKENLVPPMGRVDGIETEPRRVFLKVSENIGLSQPSGGIDDWMIRKEEKKKIAKGKKDDEKLDGP